MTRIYTASKVKHAPMWLELRNLWYDDGLNFHSHWLDQAAAGQTPDYSYFWQKCFEEVKDSDYLIAYHEEGQMWKGAFIEIGAALVLDKPVFLVGGPPGTWHHHPGVTKFDSVEDAVAEIWKRESP